MVRRETFRESVQRGEIPLRGRTTRGEPYDLTVSPGVRFSHPWVMLGGLLSLLGFWVGLAALLWPE